MVDSKEQFVRKMSDIRTRSLVESENIAADQVGCAGAAPGAAASRGRLRRRRSGGRLAEPWASWRSAESGSTRPALLIALRS